MSEVKDQIEPYYQREAARVIDVMFEGKLLRQDISRPDMQFMEDLIAYYFQSFANSARRTAEFVLKMKDHQSQP